MQSIPLTARLKIYGQQQMLVRDLREVNEFVDIYPLASLSALLVYGTTLAQSALKTKRAVFQTNLDMRQNLGSIP